MTPRLLICLGLLAALSPAAAELALERPVIELKAKPADDSVSVSFAFSNRGTRPVRVLSIDSACSCLSAELDKAVYQPGEKGAGKAEFQVSTFVGRHEKTVHVRTDDPQQAEWVIPFVLEVPEMFSVEPKTLQWWVGDEPASKTSRVRILGEAPMRITGITSTRESVEFSWKEIQPGREYEITVRPKDTSEVLLGALRIETDSEIPRYRRQLAFFSVYRRPTETRP